MDILGDIYHGFTLLRPTLGGLLCLIGAGLCLVGSVGVLRFPDFYTRLHAASVTDTGAVIVMLTGMALLSPHWLIIVKLFTVFAFLFLTGPTASHAIANAAHTAGVQPVIGRGGSGDSVEDTD